jgi:hypothetical protein
LSSLWAAEDIALTFRRRGGILPSDEIERQFKNRGSCMETGGEVGKKENSLFPEKLRNPLAQTASTNGKQSRDLQIKLKLLRKILKTSQ